MNDLDNGCGGPLCEELAITASDCEFSTARSLIECEKPLHVMKRPISQTEAELSAPDTARC